MKTISALVTALILTALPASAQAVINEIRIDQTGTDNDEFFELAGVPGTSLVGLTYVVLGDTPAGLSGVIESVTNLVGAIPASGFFLCAETSFTLAAVPDQSAGVSGLNFENTDTVTHMLVSGFTGALNQDLDTNDDGVLDVTPWTAIVDQVAAVLPASTELPYCLPGIGPELPSFAPGHIFRYPDGANTLSTWNIGGFTIGTNDTPGAPNQSGSIRWPIGNPQVAVVDVGAAYAGYVYVVAYNITGTSPGIPITATLTVPLNYDAILQASLDMANGPIFSSNVGFLDANGRGFATLNVPILTVAELGITVNCAAVVLNLNPAPVLVTNSASTTIIA